ncbi:uncharacterized protein si:dkeyp-50b9.1 isoform X8 [Scyliorhinus canicula]|uniref:uncharacterized protein si:dkeyp-50b9.1 isoform X8 n=1 Tax=Scyliorhinus canicula TaxID=7830 RepID=UPI0018F41255|nr:uncharacterized protein si:dkeyp-50b9.1 isoform X8 [Scyliorhinus canicula]
MSYFPPFSMGNDVSDPGFNVDQKQIELQLELWRDKSLYAYQAQAVCMTRLLHEIKTLRTQVTSQKEQIRALTRDLEKACKANSEMEKMFLDYKLKKNFELVDMNCINTDFSDGIYGQGLYFSPNAATACMLSVPGLILVANVCIGNAETVMTKNRERDSPSKGFDSILVPGRLCDEALFPNSRIAQEYVIFSPLQALPVGLLMYRSTTSSDHSREGTHHASH